MNIRKLILSILKNTCIFFTVIASGYALLMWFIYGTGDDPILIQATNLLFYFIFSLLLSLANGILSIQSMSKVLRMIVHYLICLFAFYACFLIPLSMAGAQNFVGLVFFTLVYLLVMGVAALFASRFKANKEMNETYVKQYKRK